MRDWKYHFYTQRFGLNWWTAIAYATHKFFIYIPIEPTLLTICMILEKASGEALRLSFWMTSVILRRARQGNVWRLILKELALCNIYNLLHIWKALNRMKRLFWILLLAISHLFFVNIYYYGYTECTYSC